MVLKEKLLHLWHKIHFVIGNNRAEATFQWIDDVLYYISGKTRVIVEEHFSEKGKTAEELIEKTVIYENAHGGSDANVKNNGGKAS